MAEQKNKPKQLSKTTEYKNLLQELKDILNKGQYGAYRAVDNIRVQTYWQIGERIVREELKQKERADYGQFLVNNLAVDLRVHKRDLYRSVKFYKRYLIVTSVMSQLSWTHYVTLIKIEDDDQRSFYANKAIFNSWSVWELQKL